MRRSIRRLKMPRPGTMLGVVAVVLALGGTAIAASTLKLGQFDKSSRDRLAGTGVIEYASTAYNTGPASAAIRTYTVTCELSKRVTAGGFKWTGPTPPIPPDWAILDQYPTGGSYVVRLYAFGASAANQPLSVYANCVKSRKQTGTPPS